MSSFHAEAKRIHKGPLQRNFSRSVSVMERYEGESINSICRNYVRWTPDNIGKSTKYQVLLLKCRI